MEEIKDQVVENENNVQESLSDTNVDNVLDSVSDEYLRKRKRTKTISYASILGVMLALAIVIIIMSVVRVDLRPAFISNPTYYSICTSNKDEIFIDENSEEYEEFYDAYKNSFNISYLTALFTGKLGAYTIEESLESFYKKNTKEIAFSSELGSDYVKLSYSFPQELKSPNGKPYYSDSNTNESLLTYEEVYFPIYNENSDKELTFYFGTTGAGYGYTITRITVRANTHALYEFATKLN